MDDQRLFELLSLSYRQVGFVNETIELVAPKNSIIANKQGTDIWVWVPDGRYPTQNYLGILMSLRNPYLLIPNFSRLSRRRVLRSRHKQTEIDTFVI
jgi:hypothetical protein